MYLLVVAVGVFACKVASGVADLVVRELWHRTARRRRTRCRGAPPPAAREDPVTENTVNGDAHGVVLQAGSIGQVHIHARPRPPDDHRP
ncbi:hypothetical protein BJF83_19880 [Nocardiopsis sp. CNR-923]|uniref:hypothetical protein n=1 Tax=Nocardiopsis sp. CNR-923 TaxID=1904965 RepID=UPI000960CED3|nr:hypothetical protein [Nocardiopsis sp. CNR-923]OLT26969.1 hypothetical protein BJF83_19880 [Nocardiopsis sp. CNR-923]